MSKPVERGRQGKAGMQATSLPSFLTQWRLQRRAVINIATHIQLVKAKEKEKEKKVGAHSCSFLLFRRLRPILGSPQSQRSKEAILARDEKWNKEGGGRRSREAQKTLSHFLPLSSSFRLGDKRGRHEGKAAPCVRDDVTGKNVSLIPDRSERGKKKASVL